MVTKRTPLRRRSLVITQEMIDLFITIQREFRSGGESQSDAGIDAHNALHVLLGLYPCTPSPALCPGPDPEGANAFLRQCYAEAWQIRLRIEEAIADARFRSRTKPSPAQEHEPI